MVEILYNQSPFACDCLSLVVLLLIVVLGSSADLGVRTFEATILSL